MNDFTNIELALIWQCAELFNERDKPSGKTAVLLNSIIRKIVNYSNSLEKGEGHTHEWVLIHTNPNQYDYADTVYYKCITCGNNKNE